ncbi:MAG: GDSL-type esterase/lipase family protein [Huintestinicola sp.]|uniref:GDSL-type esterase/lipase family protein n=1 Tax=Huintestinicola sp. TaxID=2981661 RepID=UPI003F066CD5
MSDNTIDGAKPFCGRLSAALLMAAVIFSGCGQAQEPVSPKLPSVTDYSSEVSSIRSSETSEGSTALSSDSETVSAGDAASRQTEADTSAEDMPSETEAPEETSAAHSSESESNSSVSSEETSVPDLTELAETHSDTAAPETETAETINLETECSVPAASAPVPDTNYDSEFFSSDLFIGDSISTGYSLYGFLDDKNVYAKVGLNPSTVLTKSVSTCYGEIGISTMLSYTMPKRVYIMLGSNGIQWLSVGNMLQSTDTLVDLIHETCPDTEVVIISVPPVTKGYDNTVEDVDVMAKINEYNTSLKSYCIANGMLFVDAASILKDETGYFNSTYAESDGMHFKSSAYKTLLSKIQSDVTEFEEANSPAETDVSDEAQSESESVTEEPSESETRTADETFLTLPEAAEKTDE